MILKNCTFFNEEFKKEFGDIKIENGKIEEIGFFAEDGIDMSDKIILPGFIDIHIHGGGGADFCDGTKESIDTISTYLAKRGITSFCGTTMTLPIDRLKAILSNAKDCSPKGAKLVGINLEGPFISKAKAGAQNKDFVASPSLDALDSLLDTNQSIKLMTIAPEMATDEFLEKASQRITLSIGHTEANEDQTKNAIQKGCAHATHLFNAMAPMTHRDAGTVGACLDSNIMCEIICDGEHICPSVLRSTFKVLGKYRACVISDSMRGAGLGNGEYELGGQMTYVKDDYKVARLEDGTIAASITNIFDEFKNLLDFGIDFEAALRSCTINPAKAINEDNHIGSIAIGKDADLVICDEELNLQEVYINGALA